jgi:hypothetical protein
MRIDSLDVLKANEKIKEREHFMSYEPSLEIVEMEYSCSPGGIDTFEVYDKTDITLSMPIYETESLTEAVLFCYNLGKDFTVKTLAEWNERELAYEASR